MMWQLSAVDIHVVVVLGVASLGLLACWPVGYLCKYMFMLCLAQQQQHIISRNSNSNSNINS